MDKPQKMHDLSFGQLKKTAIIYMVLPLFCYLAGFLRWYYAIASCAALLFALWKILKRKDDPDTPEGNQFRILLSPQAPGLRQGQASHGG